MNEIKVGQVIISKQEILSENYMKFLEISKKNKIKIIEVKKGDILYIEKDLEFRILWPKQPINISENILNNNSVLCKLCYKNFSCLFTGDIEETAEREIIKEYKKNLQIFNSTILKVAHHGSKTSSTKDFIEVIKPKIALIGVGKNNKFGHPNSETISKLETLGSRIYRTDENGEISININKKGKIKIKKYVAEK